MLLGIRACLEVVSVRLMLLAKTKGNIKEKKRFQMTLEAAQLLQCIKERATFFIKAVCSLSLLFPHSHGREMETEEFKRP